MDYLTSRRKNTPQTDALFKLKPGCNQRQNPSAKSKVAQSLL